MIEQGHDQAVVADDGARLARAETAFDLGKQMQRRLEAQRRPNNTRLDEAVAELEEVLKRVSRDGYYYSEEQATKSDAAATRVLEAIELARRPATQQQQNPAPAGAARAPAAISGPGATQAANAHLSVAGPDPAPALAQAAEAAPPAAELHQMPAPGANSGAVSIAHGASDVSERAPLEYALAYAALGWPVLPVGADKRPLGGKGIKHATTDEKTIREWWERWPQTGIGIHLEAAGLCAIDIDPRAGTTKTPADFPATLTARTGGGGWHLIYQAPPGVTLPGKLEPGVDIKHRGYIIVEPSVHPSGRRYAWENFDPIGEALVGLPEIAAFPVHLLPAARPALEAAPGLERTVLLAEFNANPEEKKRDIESALTCRAAKGRASDYNEWIFDGQRLAFFKGTEHEEWAFKQWCDYGRAHPRFEEEQAAEKWASFTADRTSYKPIFENAQKDGWTNPRSAAAQDYSEKVDRTDVGNANLLAQLTDGNLRFVPERRMWIWWDGHRWHEDVHGALAQREALRVARRYHAKALELAKRAADEALDEGERKKVRAAGESMRKWEATCRGKRTIEAMLAVASKFAHLQVPLEQLNRDPWLLGTPNGVVDLRTGELRPAARDDFVTKQVAVPFNPDAKAPRWKQFIDEITGIPGLGELYTKRPALAKYLHRMFGYCLTGSTAEHKMLPPLGSAPTARTWRWTRSSTSAVIMS